MSDTQHIIMQRKNDFVHSLVLKEQDHYSCTDCSVLHDAHSGCCCGSWPAWQKQVRMAIPSFSGVWDLKDLLMNNFLWLQNLERVVETFTSVVELRKVLSWSCAWCRYYWEYKLECVLGWEAQKYCNLWMEHWFNCSQMSGGGVCVSSVRVEFL